MENINFTHYGRFGLCPVIFADLESGAPYIEARYWWLEPFFTLNEFFMSIWFDMQIAKDPAYEPMFPLLVKGELQSPITRKAK